MNGGWNKLPKNAYMERINWHEEPIANSHTQQPLGRMLVPVGETAEEPPKKKRRRQSDNRERRRLIIHIVILLMLLAIICFGIYYFLHEGPRQGVPQPKAVQVDSASSTVD